MGSVVPTRSVRSARSVVGEVGKVSEVRDTGEVGGPGEVGIEIFILFSVTHKLIRMFSEVVCRSLEE